MTREPTLKELRKAAPRARVLGQEQDDEHALEFLEPGRYGADSLTARCVCLLYSITASGSAEARQALRERARVEHAEHARERRAFDTMIAGLETQRVEPNPKLDARNVHPPGGGARAAAAKRSLREPAFPVQYVSVDGVTLVMPRGYSRARRSRTRPPLVSPLSLSTSGRWWRDAEAVEA